MTSAWYRRIFPTRLAPHRQAVREFLTTAQGYRLATRLPNKGRAAGKRGSQSFGQHSDSAARRRGIESGVKDPEQRP